MDEASEINIPNIFADVYSDLFNSADDKEDILSLKQRLQGTVDVNNFSVITPNIVKTAAKSLKSNKNDVSEQFKSDSLIYAPDVVLDRLVDSLVFEVMELVIMSLFGYKLYSDGLQFGYKSKTSDTKCTWLALQTISFFKQKHTSVNVAALDCSNAFEKCLFSKLFCKILDRGVPAFVVRGLLAAYELQKASVLNGQLNKQLPTPLVSPILFTVYMDGLIVKLR